MLGAIIGDIVGSIYEFNNIKTKDFKYFFDPMAHFTDDTVMTIAISNALIKAQKEKNLQKEAVLQMHRYGHLYPDMSYGTHFELWLKSKHPKPYHSYGNGAAMRVSPVAYFAHNIEEVKKFSYDVTSVTHNSNEGIKGAEAVAISIFMALQGKSKEEIKQHIENNYYSLDFNYENLKKEYKFNETCQETVPQAIYCFLISKDFEDAIRTGISIGGDSDTLCTITGSIAEAFYGIPENLKQSALTYLDDQLKKDYNKFLKYKV